MTAMSNFIEDYLVDPSQAISAARQSAYNRFWYDEFDEEKTYEEIASPEFRLYEEMIMCPESEITPHTSDFAVVA